MNKKNKMKTIFRIFHNRKSLYTLRYLHTYGITQKIIIRKSPADTLVDTFVNTIVETPVEIPIDTPNKILEEMLITNMS